MKYNENLENALDIFCKMVHDDKTSNEAIRSAFATMMKMRHNAMESQS